MIRDSSNLPNDEFGFSCYSLVLAASSDIVALVADVQKASGEIRPTMPAHVTVKGTFYGIESLDAVKGAVRSITDAAAPFMVSFEGAVMTGGSLRLPVTPDLRALHDALVTAISPMSKAAYRDDPFSPHMTLSYLPVVDVARWGSLFDIDDLDQGFRADAVDLSGRVGTRDNGVWKLVERFPLQA